ncbi:mechanosensitive ion channel family protein [Aliidiomarina sanyensis]|uniref:Mechanosensitive ion channel protein MscS n=1 Tax=Aliidiomarina sanyensis TaxID=1249555 RepID=A0A432WKB1_9GAMM|nr:mechanosensitive ion channel domain-containing protein [Aliidiomarina sanyensis]RUO34171.1 mechanosensitive ion channel protein MscS [Aliidiomarina sanyensis]
MESHEIEQSIWQFLESAILTTENIPQAIVIVLALASALTTRRLLTKTLGQRGEASSGIRRIAIRSADRLLWPISMLVIVGLGLLVLNAFDMNSAALNVLLPLLLSFAAVRLIVYFLRKGIRGGPLLKASENIIAGVIWLILGLHLVGLLPDTLAALDSIGANIGNFRLSLLSGLQIAVLIVVALTLSGWVTHFIEKRLSTSNVITPTTRVGLVKFIKFGLITIAILIVLGSVGFDLSTLAVFGGALGVGLGFGLQRIAANFISGFILILDRSVKPGDVISVGETVGRVQELKSRYIVLHDRDGVDTLIPNENLITSEVINWSYADRIVRLRIPVDVSYSTNLDEAVKIVKGCADASPRVLSSPEPQAWVTDFGDNGITIQLRVWIADPENGFENVRSPIRLAIWRAFKEHNITIPFPQRDLHLQSMSDEMLTTLSKLNAGSAKKDD